MVSRWFSVCLSICPSIRLFVCRIYVCLYLHFLTITSVKFVKGFSPPNLVCALILLRSGLGLLMGKFSQILTELSAHVMSVFSLYDDNFSVLNISRFQQNLVCALIVEIWFRIAFE